MIADLVGTDALVLVVILVFVLGASRLPKIARSVGLAKGEFEKGLIDGAVASRDQSTKKKERLT